MNDYDAVISKILKYCKVGIDYSSGKDMTAISFFDSEAELIIESLRKAMQFDAIMRLRKKGKPVVLPGDTVYDTSDGSVYPTRVLSLAIHGDVVAIRTVCGYPNDEDIGKRIFLTDIEARDALKKHNG